MKSKPWGFWPFLPAHTVLTLPPPPTGLKFSVPRSCLCQIRSDVMSSRRKHKQVPVEWLGLRAEVDTGIAPLILALWKAGILTYNSCERNRPGVAWVEFATTQHARRFLNLVAEYPDEKDLHAGNDRTH